MKGLKRTALALIVALIVCPTFSAFGTGLGDKKSTKASSVPAPLVINFKELSRVTTDKIRIGDISETSCTDTISCKEVKNIVVAQAPAPGTTVSLDADLIARVLRNKLPALGIDLDQIKGTLPDEILVTREKNTKFEQVYSDIYRQYVLSHMPWKKQDVEITDVRVSGSQVIPGESNVTYKVKANPTLSYLGNTAISVVLYREGKRIGSVRVMGKVNVYREIARTVRSLRSHHIVSSDDIRFAKENIAELAPDVVMNAKDIVGKEIARAYRANEILKKRDLVDPMVVQKGDVVTILLRTPTLVITSKGRALEGGRAGQIMKVLNIATKRVVLGMVENKHTVKVTF